MHHSRMLILFKKWDHVHSNHISVRYILKCRRYYFLINKVYYWYLSILASYLILFRMHDSLFLFTINFYYLLGKPISIHCMLIHLNNTSYINIHLQKWIIYLSIHFKFVNIFNFMHINRLLFVIVWWKISIVSNFKFFNFYSS